MSSMRIVQILPGMRRAGAETVVANLCLGLVGLGVEVHLVVIGNRYEYQEMLADSGVRVHLLHLYYGPVHFYRLDLHWRIHRALRRFLSDLGPDVVHFHLAHGLIWGGVAAFRVGARCFYTAHGLDPDLVAKDLVARYRRWLLLQALRGSHAQVLAVAAPVANHLRASLSLSKVEIQPNPLNLDFITAKPKEPLPWSRRAMMMGTLYPLKRVAIGIEALVGLQGEVPFELWVVGDGPDQVGLQAMANRLELTDRITFFGVRQDPATLLSQVGVVWLLSEREGLPMVALEAMAMGIPLIATDVPGIKELVRHGENGLLVGLDDPLAVVLATRRLELDAALRARIVAGGVQTVQAFHPQRVALDHLARYQQGEQVS